MTHPESIPIEVPRLTVCWLHALRQIQEQMAAGCELRDVPINWDESAEPLRHACAAWLYDNSTLLQRVFDTTAIATDYDTDFGEESDTSPARAVSHAEYVRRLNAAITGLWSVMQRLEFLAESGGQRHRRWLSLHLIHAPLAACSNPYYLPC